MKTTQEQTIRVDLTHNEIVDWAKETARKEVQRVVGTKRIVRLDELSVFISREGPTESHESQYSVRVIYQEKQDVEKQG